VSNRTVNILKGLGFGFVIVLAVLCGQFLSRVQTNGVHAATTVPVPYTSILRETIIDASGKEQPGSVSARAVRSDGSHMFRMGEANGERQITFSDGRRVTVNTEQRKKSTTDFPSDLVMTAIPDPATKCVDSIVKGSLPKGMMVNKGTLAGEEVISGYRVAKITRGNNASWHALDHGCAVIQSEMNFGKEGKSVKRLVALIPGEPDPALFSVDTDYVEVPPSKMIEPNPRCTGLCADKDMEFRQRLDNHYAAHKHPGN
jgi:hypothetical protein